LFILEKYNVMVRSRDNKIVDLVTNFPGQPLVNFIKLVVVKGDFNLISFVKLTAI